MYPIPKSPMKRDGPKAPTAVHGPLLKVTESESESELLYDWRFTGNRFDLATSPLRLTTRNIFLTEHLRS
jgi:hypothetical protein